MTLLLSYMEGDRLAPAPGKQESEALSAKLSRLSGLFVYSPSLAASQRCLFFLGARDRHKYLGVLSSGSALNGFEGAAKTVPVDGAKCTLLTCPTTPANAARLRQVLPFLVAKPLGLAKSAGCGDRLGLATPGHIRAIRKSDMAPILAQQSIRENARTGRTPQQVMDDAMWGIFQEGWRDGYGADADHCKTLADIEVCAAAGYTFYTIDPGEYVDNAANAAAGTELHAKIPWSELETSWKDLSTALGGKPVDLGSFKLALSTEELLRAAAKYGRVVAHTVKMYRHLEQAMQRRPFELEMSVDETETVTSLAEHIYIAHELRRLGVRWVSLAPRYVGTFEKGVDYIGDLKAFEESFAQHLAVSRTFGPYKLSLHSGSDKFSVYPLAARVAGSLVHLKTAGTSYLEALRAIAQLSPALFREIAAFAIDRYPVDRATYHVSADVSRMPSPAALADDRLATLLDDFHGREVLHVTFGSVLNHAAFRQSFFDTLCSNEEVYYQLIEKHFDKHLQPFKRPTDTDAAGQHLISPACQHRRHEPD